MVWFKYLYTVFSPWSILTLVFLLQDSWSNAATLLFKELCDSKLLVGFVDEYVHGILHLFLCDTSTMEDVYLHHVLSTKGHAALCEENIPSQVRREAMCCQQEGQGKDCWVPVMGRSSA